MVAVILLGPDKLPQVARQVGAAWRSFSEFRHNMESEVRSSIPDLPSSADIARLARSPSALLNHLSSMDSPTPATAAERRRPPTGPTSADAPRDESPVTSGRARSHESPLTGVPIAPLDPIPCPRPHAPADQPSRSQPQLSGSSTVSFPFIGPRQGKPSPDNMTLNQHLGELRYRLIICVAAFLVATIFCVIFYEPILHFLIHPLCVANGTAKSLHDVASSSGATLNNRGQNCANLYVTSPLDGLSLRVKIAVFGGLTFASPVILFQLWRFITPGLQAREKKYAIPFATAAFVLFLVGAATAYLTLSHALDFLRAVGGPDLQQIYDPIPVPGPGAGPDGPVRDHLPIPGHTGVLGAGPRRHPGPPPPFVALGGDPHHGRRGRLHPELGPLLHAGPGRSPRLSSTSSPSASGS